MGRVGEGEGDVRWRGGVWRVGDGGAWRVYLESGHRCLEVPRGEHPQCVVALVCLPVHVIRVKPRLGGEIVVKGGGGY